MTRKSELNSPGSTEGLLHAYRVIASPVDPENHLEPKTKSKISTGTVRHQHLHFTARTADCTALLTKKYTTTARVHSKEKPRTGTRHGCHLESAGPYKPSEKPHCVYEDVLIMARSVAVAAPCDVSDSAASTAAAGFRDIGKKRKGWTTPGSTSGALPP